MEVVGSYIQQLHNAEPYSIRGLICGIFRRSKVIAKRRLVASGDRDGSSSIRKPRPVSKGFSRGLAKSAGKDTEVAAKPGDGS
jgi:hypothetical protein